MYTVQVYVNFLVDDYYCTTSTTKSLHNKTSQQHIYNFFVFHPGRCIPTFQHTFIFHFHPLTHYHTYFFCIASRHFWWCKFTFNLKKTNTKNVSNTDQQLRQKQQSTTNHPHTPTPHVCSYIQFFARFSSTRRGRDCKIFRSVIGIDFTKRETTTRP